jgi:hypothetical protein
MDVGVIRAEDFSDEKIEDLTYLHQMVMKKASFSPSALMTPTLSMLSFCEMSSIILFNVSVCWLGKFMHPPYSFPAF